MVGLFMAESSSVNSSFPICWASLACLGGLHEMAMEESSCQDAGCGVALFDTLEGDCSFS